MFSQVVQGRASDAAAVREALEGWAGSVTAGVTEDGRFIAVSECEGLAGADWLALLDGEVTVTHGTRADLWAPRDISRARFVQVVQGQVTDLDEARGHRDALQRELAVHLPCLLGALTIEHDGERFTRVLYFSTEEEARAAERARHEAVQRRDEAAIKLLVGPVTFLDLHDPWLLSPRATSTRG